MEYLNELRHQLLTLHKALLDWQTHAYEATHGKIESKAKLFDLVVGDGNFMWLRQLSELIVGLDSMLESEEPATNENIQSFLGYTKKLLTPSPTGNDFAQRYQQAVGQDGQVALLHGKTNNIIDGLILQKP